MDPGSNIILSNQTPFEKQKSRHISLFPLGNAIQCPLPAPGIQPSDGKNGRASPQVPTVGQIKIGKRFLDFHVI
jgi:hypothetical protein